jgi:hypothetical protein
MRVGGVWTALAIASIGWAGCSARVPEEQRVPMELLAVYPVQLAPHAEPPSGAASGKDEEEPERLPADAGEAVTAQIYRVLADQATFRFVPDLAVADALPAARGEGDDLVSRAVALGHAVEADGVIIGRVSRFRERVGTEMGAKRPASVAFELALVDVGSGKVVWHGQFNRTQKALSSNLFDFWMFWRAGPHWFSARELAGLGVEKLFADMTRVAGK